MAQHNPFAVHPKLPDVEQGLVLGFVCPGCGNLTKKYVPPCGCYACIVCHEHVPVAAFDTVCKLTGDLVNRPSSQ